MRISTYKNIISGNHVSTFDSIKRIDNPGFKVIDLSIFDCVREDSPYLNKDYMKCAIGIKETPEHLSIDFA